VEAAPKDAAMSVAHLERRDPVRHMARFYAVQVVPTLFGSWALVREWGRIGSPGTLRTDWFATEEEAETARARLVRQKIRRGYRLVEPEPPPSSREAPARPGI
jgi:predicted DNA-binding WGR domain protein